MAINDNTSSDDLLMGILNDPNKSDEDKIKEYTNILAGQQNEETNLSQENQIQNTEKKIQSVLNDENISNEDKIKEYEKLVSPEVKEEVLSKEDTSQNKPPSWYVPPTEESMKRYDTQGNLITQSQKNIFGEYNVLTYDQMQKDIENKKKTEHYNKQHELKKNINKKNNGLFDFIVSDDIGKTSEKIDEFFRQKPNEAQAQLENMFGKGDESPFEYEETRDKYNFNKLKVKHKESGKEIDLDFVTGDFINSNNKLFNFLNKNLSKEEKLNARKNQNLLVEEYEMYPIDLSEGQKNNIKNKYISVKDKDGNELNNIFEPQKEQVFYGEEWEQYYTVETQPYEEELERAKQDLINQGFENPSKEDIEKVARELIIKKETREEEKQQITTFMNDVEETEIYNRVKVGSNLKNENDIKAQVTYELEYKKKLDDLMNSPYATVVNDMNTFFNDPTARFAIGDEENYVTLEDGRNVPEQIWNAYKTSSATINSEINDFENWLNSNAERIENLEDSDYKNNLIQRNYNDWEKFKYNIGSGFARIVVKGMYGGSKMTSALIGVDNKTLDKTMLSMDKANAIYRESFQPDIEFKNAFKKGNFGRFLGQEIGNQIPIFATIATPGVGIPLLGMSSSGDNWTDMLREDAQNPSNESSLLKKTLTSAGYGTAEIIFDRYLTLPVMKRSWAAMYGTSSKSMQSGLDGIKQHFIQNGQRQLLIDPALETSSEGLTTVTQNILTGRPVTEDLDHALFSGGMFGYMFSGTPFVKGVMINTFSNSEVKQKYRDNLTKLTDLKIQLDGTNKYIKPSTAKILNEQVEALENENNQILEDVENRMKNMSPKYVEQFLDVVSKQEVVRNQAKKITNDSSLDSETKRKALDNLQDQFDKNQAIIDMLKDPKAFGNKYNGFLASNKKEDVDRKQEILGQATSELIEEGKTEPNDKQIQERARLIYNTQEINNDFKSKRGKTKLGRSILNFQNQEEAIEEINKLDNVSDANKAAAIKNIEEGGHGANMPTTDGNYIPFQVVENMAKDDRTETRTHELGHTILSEAIGQNSEAFTDIANQLLQYTKNQNPNLYALLVGETQGMGADEVITRYMELVAEGKIDLNSKNNKGLGAVMGFLFGKGVAKATNSDFDFNFEGETDAVAFVTNLAKKIKAGTLTLEQRKAIKKSKIAQEAALLNRLFGEGKNAETKRSEALKKNTVEIVKENDRLSAIVAKKSEEESISLKEAVTQRIKDQLVVNNMAIANKLARQAYDRGRGILTQDKAIPLEDFQQEFLYELVKLSNTWNPGVNPNFGAYVNDILPKRYGQILEGLKGKSVESVSMSTKEGDIDFADTDIAVGGGVSAKQAEGKIVNKELGLDSKKVSEIENVVKNANVPLENLTYKGVKKLITNGPLNKVLDIVSKDFGVDANRIRKNQDLDGKQREAARNKIVELSNKGNLIDMLPEGTDRSGKATGVAPSLLNKFYIKGGRAKVAEGATAAGLPIQVKKPNITNKDFLAEFGINPDGTTKKGTSLDGALRAFITQVAQLEANQQIRKNAIEQGVPTPIVEKVGEGKSEVMFSQRVNTIINVRDSFELETKGVDKLLSGVYKLAKTFNLRKQEGREAFIKAIEKDLLPLMPKDFWFGEDSTVFTASNKAYGLSMGKYKKGDVIPKGKKIGDFKYPEQAAAYNDLRDRIKALKDSDNVKFGKDIKDSNGNVIDFKVSSYNTLFETPAKIKKNLANGNIKKFNDKVSIIHKEMWKRFNEAIRKDKNKASIIGTYLKLVGNDTSHWHKLGAQFVGYSTNITGTRFEYEHAMPATAAYLYLLDASLSGNNFNASYDLVMNNYKLIALDKVMDKKLTAAKLQRMMPKDWSVIDNNWWDRYFNSDVVGVDGIGIDPNSIVGLDGKTFGENLGINSSGDPSIVKTSRKTINKINNAIEAFNKQAEAVKKINQEIQKDLEKRGYTFVEKTKMSKGQSASEMIKIIEEDLKKKGYTFSGTVSSSEFKKIGNWRIDTRTKEGRDFIKEMESIPTVSSSEPSRVTKGMSTFDFDETLIIDGENFVVATDPKTGEKINIKSGDWPTKGPELAEQGYKFNFDDFVNVRGGVDGPLLQKMKNQIDKYGPQNVFVLTARPQEAATAIDGWLKSKGINIPFENITGLADSRGEAKADWMLEKFAEGYNDMYFVDDALPNVKAVKNVLEQLDIKSKVVQAKIKFSLKAPLDFNIILEQSKGVAAGKRFSVAEARKRGISKGRFAFFVPPSAEDFKGLLYSFLGKGKEGDAHMKFFKDNLLDPYAKGYRQWNTYKQAMANDYAALKKQFKGVGKILNNKVKDTSFTNDAAIRVYLWDKAGFEIPGISKTLQDKLVNQVNNNPELKQFAEGLSIVSRRPEGYVQPSEYWTAQTIGSDLNNIVNKVGRKDFLAEWIENKDVIFSPENLNKIEAIYGSGFREALENMLYRMENGTNRTTGKDKTVNKFLNWINGSVGATMFVNIRSAVLQTISTVNFINWGDNNVFKASKAFANQPQFWKDFAFIFNSPMLKQRRAGLQIDVSASELTRAFADGRSKPEAIIAYLLEKGFTPTKIADSFAISLGGSTFYRNRLNTYLKQGMSEAKAKEQAFLDFQEIAEETQQSSRPDLISMQQAGVLGRIILAWQNTPMQMTRLTKKAMSDLINRRGSDKANISRIIYYGVVQNVIFGALQTGLMFMLFGNDEDEEKKKKMELRVANGAFDTLLRGTGVYGAAVSTLKNVLLKWREESKKGWNRDDMNIAQEAINLSPPIGSKLRKIMNAVRTEKYNRGVSKQIGLRIENPNLSIATNLTEALTNIPVARVLSKANNLEEALTGNHELWQRVALVSGWSTWSVGVKDEELEEAKADAKEARKIKKDKEKAIKKEEKKKIKEEEKKKVEEKKKEEGIKKVRCSAIKSDGTRCKITVETKAKSAKCMYHKEYTKEEEKKGTDRDGDGVKEFRCTATKSNGERCKNRTENKSKKCYAHQ